MKTRDPYPITDVYLLEMNAMFVSKILAKYNLSFVKLTCVNFKIGVIPN